MISSNYGGYEAANPPRDESVINSKNRCPKD